MHAVAYVRMSTRVCIMQHADKISALSVSLCVASIGARLKWHRNFFQTTRAVESLSVYISKTINSQKKTQAY